MKHLQVDEDRVKLYRAPELPEEPAEVSFTESRVFYSEMPLHSPLEFERFCSGGPYPGRPALPLRAVLRCQSVALRQPTRVSGGSRVDLLALTLGKACSAILRCPRLNIYLCRSMFKMASACASCLEQINLPSTHHQHTALRARTIHQWGAQKDDSSLLCYFVRFKQSPSIQKVIAHIFLFFRFSRERGACPVQPPVRMRCDPCQCHAALVQHAGRDCA